MKHQATIPAAAPTETSEPSQPAPPTALVSLKKDFRRTFLSQRKFLNRHRWIVLISGLAVLLSAILGVNPHDQEWVTLIRSDRSRFLNHLAGELGHWGDFLQYNLGLAVLIWLAGRWRRSRWLQRLAVVTLTAAIFAGMTCNLFRFTAGRPRPKAATVDGFYGMPGAVRGWNYQSFPSGHTSTAFGTATPLLVNAGPAGWVAMAFSSSVAWARVYKNQHYPTDILVGAWLGIVFGLATGLPLRRIRLRLSRDRRLTRQRRRAEARAQRPRGISTSSSTQPERAML